MIVGTAGWSVPASDRAAFPADGSALERYAQRFRGVEINSSFHRRHRPATWTRWAQSVPSDFRFSVKLPKTISHERGLIDCAALLDAFLDETRGLGDKLAVFLLQLPPRLAFDATVASAFFGAFAERTGGSLVCEPRHPSWFDPIVDELLDRHRVARVAADPARVDAAGAPGGWRGMQYWRLHGSPHMYRSPYGLDRLQSYAARMAGQSSWCVFDNTAASAATGDALALLSLVESLSSSTADRGNSSA